MRARAIACGALLGAAVLFPVAAQGAGAVPSGSGVVVNYRAHSTTATVAMKGGKLIAVHTRRVRPGTKVRLAAVRRLANGTLAGRLVATGRTRHARVRGVVAARIGARGLALSAKGTTVTVRLKGRSARGLHSMDTATTAPLGTTAPVGATVSADVTIASSGALDTEDVTVVNGTEAPSFELEGTVTAIGASGLPSAVDATTGCVAGLTSANLPDGWIAVGVGEHGLSMTAYVQMASPGTLGAPATTTAPTTTTTTTTTAPAPVTAPATTPVVTVGQELELHVSPITSTTTGQACDNQFQAVSASHNGDAGEADGNGGQGGDGGHGGGGGDNRGGSHGGGND